MMYNALSMPWAIPTIFGCLVAIVAIVSGTVAGCYKASSANRLKRAMVERGYSAAEIAQVIQVSAADTCADQEYSQSRRPPKAQKAY
jgi:hypothetical protein